MAQDNNDIDPKTKFLLDQLVASAGMTPTPEDPEPIVYLHEGAEYSARDKTCPLVFADKDTAHFSPVDRFVNGLAAMLLNLKVFNDPKGENLPARIVLPMRDSYAFTTDHKLSITTEDGEPADGISLAKDGGAAVTGAELLTKLRDGLEGKASVTSAGDRILIEGLRPGTGNSFTITQKTALKVLDLRPGVWESGAYRLRTLATDAKYSFEAGMGLSLGVSNVKGAATITLTGDMTPSELKTAIAGALIAPPADADAKTADELVREQIASAIDVKLVGQLELGDGTKKFRVKADESKLLDGSTTGFVTRLSVEVDEVAGPVSVEIELEGGEAKTIELVAAAASLTGAVAIAAELKAELPELPIVGRDSVVFEHKQSGKVVIGDGGVLGMLELHDLNADEPITNATSDQTVAQGTWAETSLGINSIRTLMEGIDALLMAIEEKLERVMQTVVHSDDLRLLEANWRSIDYLADQVESDEVIIDFVDVDKEVLRGDFEDHASFVLNSALFRKVYVDEYDRYGGRPFGTMIGLFEFDRSEDDIKWLETMSEIAAAAHCPFISAVGPEFFDCKSWAAVDRIDNIEDRLNLPSYASWDKFRRTPGAAYIGLTLPRYIIRAPYKPARGRKAEVHYDEAIDGPQDYLWGNAAVLFARNMIRSFEASYWCQHIAGVVGGGLIEALPVHLVMHHGDEELQPPVEVEIPDYRELQFANSGFIPLVHRKGTADATFFSARAVKKAIVFDTDEELLTQNADLVCNLAYTLSITRIAHYVKRMVRDYIGSTADGPYIQTMLESWLVQYVTTTVNPDDRTLLYYPFKAMSVSVEAKPGPLGWYQCIVSVLPHIQFQGMDVELRLEASL